MRASNYSIQASELVSETIERCVERERKRDEQNEWSEERSKEKDHTSSSSLLYTSIIGLLVSVFVVDASLSLFLLLLFLASSIGDADCGENGKSSSLCYEYRPDGSVRSSACFDWIVYIYVYVYFIAQRRND